VKGSNIQAPPALGQKDKLSNYVPSNHGERIISIIQNWNSRVSLFQMRDECIRFELTPSRFSTGRETKTPNIFSGLKEFFDRSQFFCARLGCSGKPHAQDPGRRSNARCDFIEAEIRVLNELSESCDQHPFSGRFSFLGSFFKNHKFVSSKRAVAGAGRANALSGAEGASNWKLRLVPGAPEEQKGSTTRNNGRDCCHSNVLFLWIAYAVQSDRFDPLYVAGSQSRAKG